jgi:hypothetical protein
LWITRFFTQTTPFYAIFRFSVYDTICRGAFSSFFYFRLSHPHINKECHSQEYLHFLQSTDCVVLKLVVPVQTAIDPFNPASLIIQLFPFMALPRYRREL